MRAGEIVQMSPEATEPVDYDFRGLLVSGDTIVGIDAIDADPTGVLTIGTPVISDDFTAVQVPITVPEDTPPVFVDVTVRAVTQEGFTHPLCGIVEIVEC